MCMSEHTRHADRVDKMYPRFVTGGERTNEETTTISGGDQRDEEVVRRRTPDHRPDADNVHREVASRICNRKIYVDVRDDLGTILPPPPVPETDLVEVAARRLSGARSR